LKIRSATWTPPFAFQCNFEFWQVVEKQLLCSRLAFLFSLMTDTNLLGNTRITRNTSGIGWVFSLCTADEGESDSEPEDASTGSHSSSAQSSGPHVSEHLRLVRDLDLGARQDAAIFKSNPWTIAKLRAATRKPPPIPFSTGCPALSSVPLGALTSNVTTRTTKTQAILDPYLKKRVKPQPTPCDEKFPSQTFVSPPRTECNSSSVANSMAICPNPNRLPGALSMCLVSPAIQRPTKTADTISAQPKHPRPSGLENRNAATSHEQEEIQSSTLETHPKGPPFPPAGGDTPDVLRIHPHLIVLVSASPVALPGHISPFLPPLKQPPLPAIHIGVSPNRFSSPRRLPDRACFLPRSSTGNSSYETPTISPAKPQSPALSVNHAGTKRKHSSSPLRLTHCPNNRTLNLLPTASSPVEPIILPKAPVHRQRAAAYDSRVFTSADEVWSTLPQKKLRTSACTDPTSMMHNSFRLPGLKLPRIGNQTTKKSWLLTTFQPPPLLKIPSLHTSEGADNLKEDDNQIPSSERINNSSSQTVVENENIDDEQMCLDKDSDFDLIRSI
jgi:hypothetical protein